VSYVWLSNAYRVMPTVYDVPLARLGLRGVLTNTAPTAPFRGAGRPEATLVIERLLDIAARRLGIERTEIRRRNLVRRKQMPYRSVTGLTYDSGDFRGNMARALDLAGWKEFPARRRAARKRGLLAGIGISNYVESPVGMPAEYVRLTVQAGGVVEVVAGTQSTGQGHETSFAQVVADQLGVTPEQVRLVTGDTQIVPNGGGTHSDRSMRLAGTLLVKSSERIVTQARAVFAALADPTRRRVLQALAEQPGVTASVLAADLPVSRQAIVKHLTALREAGLAERERSGREAHYRLRPAPLTEAVAAAQDSGRKYITIASRVLTGK